MFNQWADIGGLFRERVLPGAFPDLDKADVRALFNHDSNFVLGRRNSKTQTLELREDAQGLAVNITPPDTQWARDLKVSMQRGDIDQMSFGFRIIDQEWNDDFTERTIKKVELFDVSVVTYPAYEGTDASVRSAEDELRKARDEHEKAKAAKRAARAKRLMSLYEQTREREI